MQFGLQMPTDAFLVSFENRLKTEAIICNPNPMQLPDSPCSGVTMLDRAVFGDASLQPSEVPGVVRLEVPVTLDFVEVAKLAASGANATAPCQTATVILRFDLTIEVDGGVPALRTTFAGVEAPNLTKDARTYLNLLVFSMFPARSEPLNMAALSWLLDDTVTVIEGQIAVTSDGSKMATRFVVGGTESQQIDWQAFDAGAFGPDAGTEWSMFLSGFDRAIEHRLSKGLEATESEGKINVDSWPDVELVQLPVVGATAIAYYSIEAVDACVCFLG